jgi:hypothetical protein
MRTFSGLTPQAIWGMRLIEFRILAATVDTLQTDGR